MKLNKFFLAIQVIIASLIFTSCEDTLDVSSQIIGDGEATVDATLEFKTIATQLGKSRTPGNAIYEINTLDVVIYNEDGSFFRLIPNVAFKNETSTNETPQDYPNKPGDQNYTDREQPTAKVSFKTTLPYGRYYMYAVANLHRTLTEEEVQTIDALKAIRCTWNDEDISLNDQMFGYFTNDINESNTAFDEVDPEVVINRPTVALHSWIKRLASKVTVAYDGSKLHQNIVVWIHNVSIRQIPLACTLGEGNKPGPGENDIKVTSDAFDNSVTTPSQVLYYNNDGVTDTPGKYDTSLHNGWLPVADGTGIVGSDHSNDAQALFFYENMQGNFKKDLPEGHELKWYDKKQKRDSVGDNIGPGDKDYRDNVPYGTFIEVEAYYQCDTVPVSNGAIRYRFMLGQDTEYNYNAIRNHHYKVTLGFKGYANQPDWHIEYEEEKPAIYAPPEVYIPYTYNTSVVLPVRFLGNLTSLEAEIIENNWAPYDSTGTYEVPAKASYGATDFTNRTLKFVWYRDVFVNGSGPALAYNTDGSPSNDANNFLYGRHLKDYYHLDENGNNILTDPYYVSPIWAGFFRLRQPTAFVDEDTSMDAILLPNEDQTGSDNYSSQAVRKDFMDYFYGNFNGGRGSAANHIDLSKRPFDVSSDGTKDQGRNSYVVEKGVGPEGDYTTVKMKLWTQPKSMCGISGFSGNNPYEDYNRKGVIRFTAKFANGQEVKKDVTVIQAKRLVNPKAVWRRHDNPEDFNVTLMERDLTDENRIKFQPVVSRGEWKAHIKAGDTGFFSLVAQGSATGGGTEVTGKTLSEIKFKIDFVGEIGYTESKCAIIEVTYHNNTCVHNIFVRQGYHQPMQIAKDGPYWSSYNLYSCDPKTPYETQDGTVSAVLTRSPLSFGAFFKKGNYAQGISASNIERTNFGPLQAPGSGTFNLTGTNPPAPRTWAKIKGNTTQNWHWAKFKITLNYTDENNEEQTEERIYRVPTIAEFETLTTADFGIGVMYGDGASAPQDSTKTAFGFLDPNNTTITHSSGMRGFICYNDDASQIFFPIGTSGIGRRTTQAVQKESQRGTLRYSSVRDNLNEKATSPNVMRPICVNMANAPGSIYWANTASTGYGSWDFNYFDLNFNRITHDFTSGTGTSTYQTRGPNGDALPIRLVLDGTP